MGVVQPLLQRLTSRHRLLLRSEATIASFGVAQAALFLCVLVASSWWMLSNQRSSLREARAEKVRAVGTLLALNAEAAIADHDLTAIRRLVIESARDYELTLCRVTLADGRIVADIDPGMISPQPLPQKWTGEVVEPVNANSDTDVLLRYPLYISGRGTARLDITAGINNAGFWACWEPQTGLLAIGACALAGLLLVFRIMRKRLAAILAVRDALLACGDAKCDPSTLRLRPELGAEALAWNELLDEREQLRKRAVVEKARESLASRAAPRGFLDTACDAMSQGLILVDAQMHLAYINGAAAVMLQGKREELLGKNITDFLSDERVLKAIESVATGATRQRWAVESDRKDAGAGVLRYTIRPVRKEDSAAAMVLIEDITQQRVAQESRNAFVAQATHELRTPLTNIRLYVETAIEEGEQDPAVRAKCLNVINQETRRLERVVGEILSVSEIEAGTLKIRRDDVRLDTLVEELRCDYENAAREKNIVLSFHAPPKLPVIQGDRDKLAVALQNLLGNALKYTPPGGRVSVEIRADDGQLRMRFSDTGIGISPDERERIFLRFQRSNDPRVAKITGSGLGLSLAREVIRLHEGDITVESELNRGSTFTVTLPLTVTARV